MSETRRDFVKAAAGLSAAAAAAVAQEYGEIPKRRLGRTDLHPTILGLGGARVGNVVDEKQAIATMHRMRDLGVNYFDSAAAGAYGISQQRYGRAFGKDNKDIIYATKTRHRTWAHSELDLNQSLSNFKRDYIDLYMVHNVMHQEDIDFIFGKKGLMEMIERAKRDGKIRYVAFTGHMDPQVLRKMVGLYDWDAMLMPLSVTDGARKDFSFEHTTLPAVLKKEMGVIAMKVTGVNGILNESGGSIEECLNYVWSLPISTAILGCSTPEEAEIDAKLASAFEKNKLSKSKMEGIRKKWAKADFDKLETWKVDQTTKTVAADLRYLGC